MKLTEARQMFNIHPRTKKALTVWELANIAEGERLTLWVTDSE